MTLFRLLLQKQPDLGLRVCLGLLEHLHCSTKALCVLLVGAVRPIKRMGVWCVYFNLACFLANQTSICLDPFCRA